MSVATDPKQYVEKCELSADRLAITFRFPGAKFTWQHRGDRYQCCDWETEVVAEYESCARGLTRGLASRLSLNVSLGNLTILVNAKPAEAKIMVEYYEYGEDKTTLEAEYEFAMPAKELAAAFEEAVRDIRNAVSARTPDAEVW